MNHMYGFHAIHSFRSYHIEDPEFSSYRYGKLLEYMWHIIFTDNPIMEDRNFTIKDTGEVWSIAPEKPDFVRNI